MGKSTHHFHHCSLFPLFRRTTRRQCQPKFCPPLPSSDVRFCHYCPHIPIISVTSNNSNGTNRTSNIGSMAAVIGTRKMVSRTSSSTNFLTEWTSPRFGKRIAELPLLRGATTRRWMDSTGIWTDFSWQGQAALGPGRVLGTRSCTRPTMRGRGDEVSEWPPLFPTGLAVDQIPLKCVFPSSFRLQSGRQKQFGHIQLLHHIIAKL